MSDESSSLLEQYVRDRSQDAFAAIVRRYVDMVYASARRQVRDAELAQDVTQAVFVVLSQKAKKVPAQRPLSAWLLTTTRYVAANARRAREHRELHERRAAQMARAIEHAKRDDDEFDELLPLLDEGLTKLAAGERDALVLKYFEKKTLRQVGEALGISEEAATKRVSRAVERLRGFFQSRGAAVPAGVVAAFLLSESAQAAPVGLAATVSAGASASALTMAQGAVAVMATEKVKAVALLAGMLLLGGGAVAVVVTSMMSSPAARTVTIAGEKMDAAASATPASGAQWQVTFSDGTMVEVLGVNNLGSTTPTWWGADGSAVRPPALRRVRGLPSDRDHVARQMVLRMRSSRASANDVSIRIEPAAQTHIMSSSTGSETLINCVAAVPSDAPTATVYLELANGASREQAKIEQIALSPNDLTSTRPALSEAGR